MAPELSIPIPIAIAIPIAIRKRKECGYATQSYIRIFADKNTSYDVLLGSPVLLGPKFHADAHSSTRKHHGDAIFLA